MARALLPISTYRNPVKRSRAIAIKALMDDLSAAADRNLMSEYLGAPDLADDNHFLISTSMIATAYTLDETALPANNPPRNIIVTHTANGGADTFTTIVLTGTDVDDAAITETLTIASGSTVVGTKAFKTLTSAITADWVTSAGADTIEIGFNTLIGLSVPLAATTDVFGVTLNGIPVTPSAIAVHATIVSENTIDISAVVNDTLLGEYLGAPDLADNNYFLISVNMQATAYTLDQTALPANNPPRNVIITHTQVGGVTDTLGDAVIVGTDVNDNPITETLTVADGSTVIGTKAFKTITSVTTASWVIDTTEDTIEVGFNTLIGLSVPLAAVTDIFGVTLAGRPVVPTAIVVNALVEENTINVSASVNEDLMAEYLGAPDAADDNHFLISVVMQATAYTLDETTLPADNPPRNVICTHTTDTTTDTLGDAIIVGTDVNDAVITETLTLSADGTVIGTKAFKTITSVTTAGWVQGGGVSDLLEVGFDTLVGLSIPLAAASDVFMATLAGVALLPSAIAVSSTLVEENTIDISGGTFDSSKAARAMVIAGTFFDSVREVRAKIIARTAFNSLKEVRATIVV